MSKTEFFFIILCLSIFVFKIISIQLTSFDLFGDEAQYWLWSKDLDYGYYSKPPLLSWIIGLFCSIFGNSIFVIKMIPVLMYCLSSYVIFLLSKKIFRKKDLAFCIATTFFLMPAVSVSSFLISTDVLLIFFWSLSMLQIYNIKENPNIMNFSLLGIFVGLAFLSKYAAIYFIICLMLLLFIEKDFREIFFRKKIYLLYFILTTILIIAPNIIWNINNDWATFEHTADNASLKKIKLNLLGGMVFIVSQIFMIGPIVFLFFIFGLNKYKTNDFNIRFLLIFSIPIFVIILIESILVRANANWAAVSLISFLILFTHIVFTKYKKAIIINNVVNYLFGLAFFVLIATNSTLEPFKRISGISNFANTLILENPQLNNLVVTDRMLFSNLSYVFYEERIKMFVPHPPGKKINNHFQMTSSLPSNFDSNFIFIGNIDELKYLKKKYSINFIDEKNISFLNEPIKIYAITF